MILFLSNADTDILAVRSVVEALPEGFCEVRCANPATSDAAPAIEGCDAVAVRLLGGRRAWEQPFGELRAKCIENGVPLLAFSGEAVPDAELTALSSAPAPVVDEAFGYLAHGGLRNMENFLRFVGDRVLGGSFGFTPPLAVPAVGTLERGASARPGSPSIGIVFYRAHMLSGNTRFVEQLADAIEERAASAVCVYCYSLRPDQDGRVEALDVLRAAGVDVVITTVLAMGSSSEEGWDASALAALDVPVVQAVAATSSSSSWWDSQVGLSPLDVAMSIAIPEFDGRIVSVPFSFKEVVEDAEVLGSPVAAYRSVADRVERVAGLAIRLAALRHKRPYDKKVALVLSAYPTRRSRIGNAVGLDTPASVIEMLESLAQAGYRVDGAPADAAVLMDSLTDSFSYDRESLSTPQVSQAVGRMSGDRYREVFEELPGRLRDQLVDAWEEPPGRVHTDGGDLVFCGLDLGGVLVAVQPPRGYGENPIAVYHSPDLPPTHHYIAFYRWLDETWGADAVVHLGKHGTLEWLPGKGTGLSAACAPDAALGDLPLVYPFVVNDPGEGTQAKRRAHAVIVDHLVPPMTRADSYDELARLESLLDEHARAASVDPGKLPAVRQKVWELLVEAQIHRDLGVSELPSGEDFDELVLNVDGYLCELKDAQIRGGLHVLGQPPSGEAELDMVLAVTRVPQGGVPSLRRALKEGASREEVDALEASNRQLLSEMQRRGWTHDGDDPTLRYICDRLVPALRSTSSELSNVVGALDGHHIPSGPSGAPTRGMAHVLPTGRNFYSVDPKAVPSPFAWEVGTKLADQLVERHVEEEGHPPRCVGLVVWGTSAMRTMGDDVAEALALLGVRPRWHEESGRVAGLELMSEEELGRARIDVTLRISGFFRDAFPHVIEMLDEAMALAGFDDEPRIFGSMPGAYGSGILNVLESRNWRDEDDLALVYETWSGWSYGRGAMGVEAPGAMRRRFSAIEIAVKNQDNREHDIFDSDDYLQDHGGMVATVRALTGKQPKAWFGDSSDPARPRVRSLGEEAARVVRTRVINPKWIAAMQRHGYKGAFEMAATVDYLFGYDATALIVEDWMYERVTRSYVMDPEVRKFFESSNPWALRSISERLLEAHQRGLWNASTEALSALRSALLEAEGWEESR